MKLLRTLPLILAMSAAIVTAAEKQVDDSYRPHTPTLLFHLTGADDPADANAIRDLLQKLPSVSTIVFTPGAVRVRFDSHVVSYHEVAQAIASAGKPRGKQFDPVLKLTVPEYAAAGNAAKVDALLGGKRLNQRVQIVPMEPKRGEFLIHFLPLAPEPSATGPQGFNGGHLNHPLHDPPPRGLGLTCVYESGAENVP